MKTRVSSAAFTLIELLVVIAIIGILAAIVGPSLTHFQQGDAMLSGSRQMLDAVARARQLAITQRTTVYLVFVRDSFWTGLSAAEMNTIAATNLADKQLIGYNFVAVRSVGDQPGQNVPRFLSSWQTLPDKTYIAPQKFINPNPTDAPVLKIYNPTTAAFLFDVLSFRTNALPFPSETSSNVIVPSIGFDYQGRLVSQRDEYIPLIHGSVGYARDPSTKAPLLSAPTYSESQVGSVTNSYNIIHIDWLTGRARALRQEIQ